MEDMMATRKPYYAALQQELLVVYGRAMQPGAAKVRLRETRLMFRAIRAFKTDAVFATTYQRSFWLDIEFVRRAVKSRLNGRHKRLRREQRALERELKALGDEFKNG